MQGRLYERLMRFTWLPKWNLTRRETTAAGYKFIRRKLCALEMNALAIVKMTLEVAL